ncbi:MAG: DNA-3-methyladenine glycosylase I [Gemmatimonadota bacterium]
MDELTGTAGAVIGEDGIARCAWAASDATSREYHDREWGVPVHGESELLERITLEAFQSGLSWLTILRKRNGFRAAFDGFDADAIAAFTNADVERLMDDAGIVRNRKKIEATRSNARATLALRTAGGLDALLWSFKPPSAPAPSTMADLPTQNAESKALAAELRRRGFVFVGPTTMYALMQAVGMIDAHVAGCHRRGCTGG